VESESNVVVRGFNFLAWLMQASLSWLWRRGGERGGGARAMQLPAAVGRERRRDVVGHRAGGAPVYGVSSHV
jgi:hypothetical protein